MTQEEIKSLRKKLKLNQAQFAKKLDVDFSTVSKWESGKRRPGRLAKKVLARLIRKLENHDNNQGSQEA